MERRVISRSIEMDGKIYHGVRFYSGPSRSFLERMHGIRIKAAFKAYITNNGDIDSMAKAILAADKIDGIQKYPHNDTDAALVKARKRAKAWITNHFTKMLNALPSQATVEIGNSLNRDLTKRPDDAKRGLTTIPIQTVEQKDEYIKRISDERSPLKILEILNGVDLNKSNPSIRTSFIRRFERNPILAGMVKQNASFKCEICNAPGFSKNGGGLFAEAHHTEELSKGGMDVLDNMMCVCPTCHKVLHFGTQKALKMRRINHEINK